MKIEESDLSLLSFNQKNTQTKQSESLQVWNSKDGENGLSFTTPEN